MTVSPRTSTSRPAHRVLAHAVAAEWTKLWTVRSTWASLLALVALVSLFAVIAGVADRSGAGGATTIAATDLASTGVVLMGQLAVLALATLVIAAEYSTTSIRTTLQCVPVRGHLLVAKAAVLAPVCLVAGAAATAIGVLAAMAATGRSTNAPAGAAALVEAPMRAGLYLALAASLVVGIGALVRSVAGGLAVSVGVLLLLPMLMGAGGVPVLSAMAPYLPGGAGQVLLGTADTGSPGAGVAVAVLCGWVVAVDAAAVLALRARDA